MDVKFSQDLTHQKSLQSVNFWQSYWKNKSGTFFGTKGRTPSYVIILKSYTLLKVVQFFGPPCICLFIFELSSLVSILQVTTLLDTDLWHISVVILTHFKLLVYYKLDWGTKYLFLLDHRVVNDYFRYEYSIKSSTENSSRKQLHSYSPTTIKQNEKCSQQWKLTTNKIFRLSHRCVIAGIIADKWKRVEENPQTSRGCRIKLLADDAIRAEITSYLHIQIDKLTVEDTLLWST